MASFFPLSSVPLFTYSPHPELRDDQRFSRHGLRCPMGGKQAPGPPPWAGAILRCTIGAPSAGLSLGRVARQQSPPPFHPAAGVYRKRGPQTRASARPEESSG